MKKRFYLTCTRSSRYLVRLGSEIHVVLSRQVSLTHHLVTLQFLVSSCNQFSGLNITFSPFSPRVRLLIERWSLSYVHSRVLTETVDKRLSKKAVAARDSLVLTFAPSGYRSEDEDRLLSITACQRERERIDWSIEVLELALTQPFPIVFCYFLCRRQLLHFLGRFWIRVGLCRWLSMFLKGTREAIIVLLMCIWRLCLR